MDTMKSSGGPFESLIKQEPTDQSLEPRIKDEHLSIEHLGMKKEVEFNDSERDLEIEIDIKDEKYIEKKECHEIPLSEVCDKPVKIDVEGNDQEADIKEEPEDETYNIYVCTLCDEIHESKEDLINHKKETPSCHEHKMCDECEAKSEIGFTCIWELEDHLKTVHGVENQDVLAKYAIQELQLEKNEDVVDTCGKKKLYPCRFCPKILNRSHLRTCHERLHTGEKPYQCSVCGKSFSNNSNLHDHEAIHSGEKRFSCSFCEKTFICSSNRKRHERTHVEEKCFACPICDDFFSSRILLKEHKETHSETPYACGFCPRLFSSNYNRNRHEKVHSRSKPLKLKKIRHSFLSTELINEDTAQKLKCVSCDVCFKSFACDAKLQVHRKIHTEEKLFACGSCEKSFTSSSLLKKHEVIHSSVKPFSCSFCPKSFLYDYKRVQHERIHNGEKPYLCRYCDMSFSTYSIASDHENTHTGERPYTCDICNRSFTRKGTLQIHTRVHTGEKPCSCNICGKTFTYLSSLRKHERIHKSETNHNS